MEELIRTFHIDIKLILAQVVNFAIVVFVLYKFAYKPLLNHMNDRTNVIQKGLDDAKKAQQQLEKSEISAKEKLLEAKQEAREILQQAQTLAEKNKEEIVAQAKVESEKVVAQAKSQILAEKEKLLQEVKKEIGGLVIHATEKVISQRIGQDEDQKLINEVVNQIK